MIILLAVCIRGAESITPTALRVSAAVAACSSLWYLHFRRLIPWLERHTSGDSALLAGLGVHSRRMYLASAVGFGVVIAMATIRLALV